MGYLDIGLLESMIAEQTAKIKAYNMQVGDFVNMSNEFGYVWHEVTNVFNDSCTVATFRDGEVKVEYERFSRIRQVAKTLPENTRMLFTKTGHYNVFMNERIPPQYFQKQLIQQS